MIAKEQQSTSKDANTSRSNPVEASLKENSESIKEEAQKEDEENQDQEKNSPKKALQSNKKPVFGRVKEVRDKNMMILNYESERDGKISNRDHHPQNMKYYKNMNSFTIKNVNLN